jgi:DNA modification methylase
LPYTAFLGDSLEILKTLPSCSVDSLVTDPPAGIALLDLDWDRDRGGRDEWIAWLTSIMEECQRVMKPGAHGLVWALPRTSHWTATALENAGFHVKDVIVHIFGTGFPKSTAIDKAMDRAKYTDTDLLFRVTAWIRARRDELVLTNKDLDGISGVSGGACHWTALPPHGQPHIPTLERWDRLEKILGPPPEWMAPLIRPARAVGDHWKSRSVVGEYTRDVGGIGSTVFRSEERSITEATREESLKWKGWGTALKPGNEHWILIQNPITEHNIAANVKKFGTGALHIDASRIPVHGKIASTSNLEFQGGDFLWDNSKRSRSSFYNQHPAGRFPANLLITRSNDESCPARILDNQSDGGTKVAEYFKNFRPETSFVYCKKPGKAEKGDENIHPTVKPLRLMRYFCQMITPSGGVVLDPFMGSGTTGVAALFERLQFIGIERDPNYHQIAERRLKGIK